MNYYYWCCVSKYGSKCNKFLDAEMCINTDQMGIGRRLSINAQFSPCGWKCGERSQRASRSISFACVAVRPQMPRPQLRTRAPLRAGASKVWRARSQQGRLSNVPGWNAPLTTPFAAIVLSGTARPFFRPIRIVLFRTFDGAVGANVSGYNYALKKNLFID